VVRGRAPRLLIAHDRNISTQVADLQGDLQVVAKTRIITPEPVTVKPGGSTDNGVRRIVIAEDDRRMQRLLELVCHSDPRCDLVAMVDTGKEAIGAVLDLEPDVVVLDMSLPGSDGVTAARIIRRAADRVRIVICSAYGDGRDDANITVDAWVKKPFDQQTLVAAILGDTEPRVATPI